MDPQSAPGAVLEAVGVSAVATFAAETRVHPSYPANSEGVGTFTVAAIREGLKELEAHAIKPDADGNVWFKPGVGFVQPPIDDDRSLAAVDEHDDCEEPPTREGFPKGVRAVLREARPLVTFGATSTIWTRNDFDRADYEGRIVRLYPPEGLGELKAETLAESLRLVGAVAVKIMPRTPAPNVLPGALIQEVRSKPVREVVRALVLEARTTDRPLLFKLVEEALDAGDEAARAKGDVLVPLAGEPLTVEMIEVLNWARYRGEHRLNLTPTIYGVTARQEQDPERSNWQGKSTLVEAIPFALYGWHRWAREDDWITRGEERGGVVLHLSDGTQIRRSRWRGKSTQLAVERGETRANQGEAQKMLERLVGLSEADFFATCFFKQKDLARFIKAKPAERLGVVRGWLDLEPLVAAEAWVWGQLEVQDRAERGELARIEEQSRVIAQCLDVLPVTDRGVNLTTNHEAAQQAFDTAVVLAYRETERLRTEARVVETAVAEASGAAERWHRYNEARSAAEQLPPRREELAKVRGLRAKIDDGKLARHLPKLKAAADEAFAAWKAAQAEAVKKRELAAGAFNGNCPITCEKCPITAEINEPREKNAQLHAAAVQAQGDAGHAERMAGNAFNEANGKLEMAKELDRQIEALEATIARCLPAEERAKLPPPPKLDAPLPDAGHAWAQVQGEERRLLRLEESQKGYEEARAKLVQAEARRKVGDARTGLLREALAIVGKGGAQRAVAVGELAEIERAANEQLASAGVDLTVSIRWGRESATGALAATCEGCGSSFAGKVKSCGKCGAARGLKLEDKLDVELSDVSGAAEDLAGVAVQVAASAWLRARRGARWQCVVIDEPFGALDVSNARGLAVHLAGMLGRGAFRQGLVIAHTPAAMDALPGRIVVTGGPDGSTIGG